MIDAIHEENAQEWFQIIRRCAQTKSNDLATFPPFGRFLLSLGGAKPKILLGYLRQVDEDLAQFLSSFLKGLSQPEFRPEVEGLLADWIENNRFLGHITWAFRNAPHLDVGLLERATARAIELDDQDAVVASLESSIVAFDQNPRVVDSVFFPAARFLSRDPSIEWLGSVWNRYGSGGFFEGLDDTQSEELLELLSAYPRITYHEEQILLPLANRRPEQIIAFFARRAAMNREALESRFEPLPYQLDPLLVPLSANPRLVVTIARRQFDEDSTLFAYRAGRLVHMIFPNWNVELDAYLRELVRSGDLKTLEFILGLLDSYEGEAFLTELCKDVVDAVPEDDVLLSRIGFVFDATGVVSGEFGLADAYAEKRDAMQSWLTDPRERVVKFARHHINNLELQAALERQRAQEWIELRNTEE